MPLNTVEEMYTHLITAPSHEIFRFYKKNGAISYDHYREGVLKRSIPFYDTETALFNIIKNWTWVPLAESDFNPIHIKIREMSKRFEERKKVDVKNSKGRTVSEVSISW